MAVGDGFSELSQGHVRGGAVVVKNSRPTHGLRGRMERERGVMRRWEGDKWVIGRVKE